MQLTLSHVERSSALDERIEDLLSAARSHLGQDNVRALYFANEAHSLAAANDRVDLQLKSLLVIIDALKRSGRAADVTPFIARAIELAPSVGNRSHLDDLLDLLGQWAIELERKSGRSARSRRHAEVPMGWLVSAISQLEHERGVLADAPSEQAAPVAEAEPIDNRRAQLGIDDSETGLLNGRGLAAELLQLQQQTNQFALIQITVVPDDVPINEIAALASKTTGTGGILARNARSQITIILPFYTGFAAMALAEELKKAMATIERASNATIGIGVAYKLPHESAQDVLRRVTDRAEEAAWKTGISVVG